MLAKDALAGKVAVVTGGGTGIGVGICESLAGAGASVVISPNSNVEGAQRTAARLAEGGAESLVKACDVREHGQVQALFDAALERFQAAYHDDPLAECRGLFCDLLWPLAEEEGKPGLVEMSSHNVREAQTLRRIFPEARFVHAVRDGRDAASSVTTKTWGPDGIVAGIDWWADRLRAIDAGVRGEEDGSPYTLLPDRLCVVVLDDLVGGDREAAYARLAGFVGTDEDAAMREFFALEMSPASAHRARWREGLGRLGRRRVLRKYERTLAELERLEREGYHCAAVLRRAYERSAAMT